MQAFILVINLACMEQKFCPILGETNAAFAAVKIRKNFKKPSSNIEIVLDLWCMILYYKCTR